VALTFGAATTDRVDIALGLGTPSALSILMWVYPTTRTNARRWWAQSGTEGGVYSHNILWNFVGTGIEIEVVRTTSSAIVVTSDTWTLNKWWCLVVTYSEADGIDAYRGDLTTELAQLTYSTDTTGVGTTKTAAEDRHQISNIGTNNTFQGRIARAVRWRRRMTLAEAIGQQWITRPDADTDFFFELGYAGTGTQPNLTSLGNGKNGTVTGATVSDHAPLPMKIIPRRSYYKPPTETSGLQLRTITSQLRF
jgi:hypothetical protein